MTVHISVITNYFHINIVKFSMFERYRSSLCVVFGDIDIRSQNIDICDDKQCLDLSSIYSNSTVSRKITIGRTCCIKIDTENELERFVHSAYGPSALF